MDPSFIKLNTAGVILKDLKSYLKHIKDWSLYKDEMSIYTTKLKVILLY